MRRCNGLWGLLLAAVIGFSPAIAADNGVPPFPRNPAQWLHSWPVNEKSLEGKAALLYFFEES